MLFDIKPFKDVKKETRVSLPAYSKKWTPPKDFPNLSSAKSIAIDTETYDPELLTIGPGWGRGVGHIVGVSIATVDAAWYFPVRHKIDSQDNLNPDNVFSYLRDLLQDNKDKVFANALYDVGWLTTENIYVGGRKYDVQFAEAVLDGNAYSYALDNIAKKYLGEGKSSNELYEWCSRAYGGKPDGSQRKNIWRAPPALVGPYAEADARLPFQILKKQWSQLDILNLLDVFRLECDLIDLLIQMRLRGIPISEERAYFSSQKVTKLINEKQQRLNELAGREINVDSTNDLQYLYDKAGIKYEYTEKGNPSFKKAWLERQYDEASKLIIDIRKYTKARDTFLKGAILEKHTNGRVHPSFHPLRSDSGGTVTGRFAASQPAVQQIPSRDKEIGPLIRSCFLPEEGYEWVKADYSSIELRMLAHFSNDKDLIQQYRDDPFTDYHAYVGKELGGKLPRIAVKTMNFSLVYGGGKATITSQMGMIFTMEEIYDLIKSFGVNVLSKPVEQLANLFITHYHKKFPIAKRLLEECSQIAQRQGEIRTILNRRTTFDKWEPIRGKGYPLPYEAAVSRYGKAIRRAETYKALNYRLQGSAADLIKKGMVLAYKEGLFNRIPIYGQVHDELDLGYHPDLHNEFVQLAEIMETAIEFNVPIIMEMEKGPSWAEAKEKIDIGERHWWNQ